MIVGRLLLVFMLGGLVVPSLASAQERVAIVVVAGDEAALERDLVAELRALGFTADRRGSAARLDAATLAELAEAHDASAVIAIRRSAEGVEVWVGDRLTGKLVIRVVSDVDPRTTVLRSVEVLRASFLEALHPPASRPAAEAPALSVATRRLTADEAPARVPDAFALSLGPGGGVSYDPGGLGLGGHVALDLVLETPSFLEARLWSVTTVGPLAVESSAGRAEQTIVMIGVSLLAQMLPSTSVVSVRAGVGASLLWMESRGLPGVGFVGRTVSTLGSGLSAELGATLWFDDRVGLDLGWQGILALPRLALVFDEEPVARWGEPALFLTLSIKVRVWHESP